jgi:hypothetical protein
MRQRIKVFDALPKAHPASGIRHPASCGVPGRAFIGVYHE